MRFHRIVTGAVFATAIVSACSDENNGIGPGANQSGLALSELVGTWRATSLEAMNKADPSETVDLVALGGAATGKIEPDRRVAFVGTLEGETDASTGVLTISGDYLSIAGDGNQESVTFSCALSEGTMTLTSAVETYDFDGDGTEEPAVLTMVFEPSVDVFAIADLVGTWEATRWEFTNDADPLEKVEVIGLGAAGTVTVQSSSRYTLLITDLDGTTETNIGNLQVLGEYIVALNDAELGNPDAFACALSGATMILTSTDATYDFDEDGVEEDASLTIEWDRT